jgi:hypothetical protein
MARPWYGGRVPVPVGSSRLERILGDVVARAVREIDPSRSPRRAIVAAYKLGLVDDETLWIGMLADRNLTSHP